MQNLVEKNTRSARSALSAWSAWSADCSLHGLRFGVTEKAGSSLRASSPFGSHAIFMLGEIYLGLA